MRRLLSFALVGLMSQLPPGFPTPQTPEGIRGTVRTVQGAAAEGLTVVFFPEDQAIWTTPIGQKLLITARVTNGEYAISPVPAGKYKLAAVRTDAVPATLD